MRWTPTQMGPAVTDTQLAGNPKYVDIASRKAAALPVDRSRSLAGHMSPP
jgi:hypothetical protein